MSRKIISVFIILLMISSLSFSVFAETLNEKKEDVKSKFDVVRSVILEAVSQSAEITNEELQTMFNQNFNGRSYIKEK